MTEKISKLPRLYVPEQLGQDIIVSLNKEQTHYLGNVLRQKTGAYIRAFHPASGEWLCEISDISKKSASITCLEQLRKSAPEKKEIHLFFAPVKKNRMDFLIEKSVELGVTHLHPVITEHTEVRKINKERLEAQIIEAAEQCERLSIPELLAPAPLNTAIQKMKLLYAAIERQENTPSIGEIQITEQSAFLIGPEGGFSDQEISFLNNQKNVTPVSLGQNILRAETAALKILSCITRD